MTAVLFISPTTTAPVLPQAPMNLPVVASLVLIVTPTPSAVPITCGGDLEDDEFWFWPWLAVRPVGETTAPLGDAGAEPWLPCRFVLDPEGATVPDFWESEDMVIQARTNAHADAVFAAVGSGLRAPSPSGETATQRRSEPLRQPGPAERTASPRAESPLAADEGAEEPKPLTVVDDGRAGADGQAPASRWAIVGVLAGFWHAVMSPVRRADRRRKEKKESSGRFLAD